MKKLIYGLGILLFTLQLQVSLASPLQEHEALRKLRTLATNALNTQNFTQLASLLDKSFTITTVDNHKFTNLQEFKNYWDNLFKSKHALLKQIKVDPTADALTEFLTPNIGVVYGTSADTYYFTDGDVRQMPTRWTGVVRKDAGVWKIVALHFSANLMNNPVLNSAKHAAYWFGVIGLIIGLILGMLILYLATRRRTYA